MNSEKSGIEIFLEKVKYWETMEKQQKDFFEKVGEKDFEGVLKKIQVLEKK